MLTPEIINVPLSPVTKSPLKHKGSMVWPLDKLPNRGSSSPKSRAMSTNVMILNSEVDSTANITNTAYVKDHPYIQAGKHTDVPIGMDKPDIISDIGNISSCRRDGDAIPPRTRTPTSNSSSVPVLQRHINFLRRSECRELLSESDSRIEDSATLNGVLFSNTLRTFTQTASEVGQPHQHSDDVHASQLNNTKPLDSVKKIPHNYLGTTVAKNIASTNTTTSLLQSSRGVGVPRIPPPSVFANQKERQTTLYGQIGLYDDADLDRKRLVPATDVVSMRKKKTTINTAVGTVYKTTDSLNIWGTKSIPPPSSVSVACNIFSTSPEFDDCLLLKDSMVNIVLPTINTAMDVQDGQDYVHLLRKSQSGPKVSIPAVIGSDLLYAKAVAAISDSNSGFVYIFKNYIL